MNCPHCGQSVDDREAFCIYCGFEKERREEESTASAPKCRNCGHPMEAGEIFCGNCGQKQEAGRRDPTRKQPTRSLLVTLTGLVLLILGVRAILNGLVPMARYNWQESYRIAILDQAVQKLRDEVFKIRQGDFPLLEGQKQALKESVEAEITTADADRDIRAGLRKILISTQILGVVSGVLGFGILRRWRWFRLTGIVVGVFMALAMVSQVLRGMADGNLTSSHHVWGPPVFAGVISLILLVGLIGRRKKEEFRRRINLPSS